jgi:lysophospholipase L1-like esterase
VADDKPKDPAGGELSLRGLKYGFLNDVSDTGMEGSTDRRRSGGVNYLRSAIKANYSRRALEKVNVFTGIVIAQGKKAPFASRNADSTLKQHAMGKWTDVLPSLNNDDTVNVYKVYIPEIECRPAPGSYTDPIIATYYDVYNTLETGIFKKEPTIGSVVSVRFDNINNFTGARIVELGETIAFLDDIDGNLAAVFGGGAGDGAQWMGRDPKMTSANRGTFAKSFNRKPGLKCGQEPPAKAVEVAKRLNIDIEVIQAIAQVESGGKKGVVMRFEAHLWHDKASAAAKAKVPYTHPGPDVKGRFSRVKSESDIGAFNRAFALNKKLAIQVTSFGAYQVLGQVLLDHYGPDPDRALQAYYDDPDNVAYVLLEGWFKTAGGAVKKAAQEKDFVRFARTYNGPSQKWHYGGAIAREYNAVTCGKHLQIAANPEDPKEPTPGAVLYLGDSQHAAGYSFGGKLRADLKKQGVPYIINMTKDGRGVSAGQDGVISGNSLKNELSSRVAQVKPKYAIVGLGGNDAGTAGYGSENNYKTKYLKPLVQLLKDGGVEKIVWLGPTKPSVPDVKSAGDQKYYKEQDELARRSSIRRWQASYLPTLGVTYINMESLTQTRQTADGVHYTAAEYGNWYQAAKGGVLKGPIEQIVSGVKADMAAAEAAAVAENDVQEEEGDTPPAESAANG